MTLRAASFSVSFWQGLKNALWFHLQKLDPYGGEGRGGQPAVKMGNFCKHYNLKGPKVRTVLFLCFLMLDLQYVLVLKLA